MTFSYIVGLAASANGLAYLLLRSPLAGSAKAAIKKSFIGKAMSYGGDEICHVCMSILLSLVLIVGVAFTSQSMPSLSMVSALTLLLYSVIISNSVDLFGWKWLHSSNFFTLMTIFVGFIAVVADVLGGLVVLPTVGFTMLFSMFWE